MDLRVRISRCQLSQVKVFWRELGEGENIIFLHGAWQNSAVWLPMMFDLANDYHCIAPDLLGFGDSQLIGKSDYNIDLIVEFLSEYLSNLKLDKVLLLGEGLGAWIAASFVLKYPEKIDKLILIEPIGLENKQIKSQWKWGRYLSQPVPLTVWWLKFWSLYDRSGSQEYLDLAKNLRLSPASSKLLCQRRWADIANELLGENLSLIEIPALIIAGEQASQTVLNNSRTYANLIPKGQLQLIAEADDNLLISHLELVVKSITDWLK
ncbi:MAG: alpha/beta fold hydrolase [Microcoleaceae cyanobacterium]